MTWTRLSFNGEPFENEVIGDAEEVVIGAPREVAIEWWKDQYGVDPERTTDDDLAWTVTEKKDPDVFARFILGEIEYGGVGAATERPAELADMRDSDEVKVLMPKQVSQWSHTQDVDPKVPERPWVPEHARDDGRGKPDFVPDPFGDDDEEHPGEGHGRGR